MQTKAIGGRFLSIGRYPVDELPDIRASGERSKIAILLFDTSWMTFSLWFFVILVCKQAPFMPCGRFLT